MPTVSPSPSGRGRPPKFGRPSRAVTVTLPEDVLARLRGLDDDLGRAIVELVERRPRGRSAPPPPRAAEIASYGRHAVIVVTPLRSLKKLHGVELVPIGNGRALISLAPGRSVPAFELDVRDAAAARGIPDSERRALHDIAEILQHARARRSSALSERTIIVLESKRRKAR